MSTIDAKPKDDQPKDYDARLTVEIPLEFPINFDGEKIGSLTMRRPKMADSIWIDKQGGTDSEKTAKLMARLCNVRPELIAELDDIDSLAVDQQYGRFRGQKAS